MKIEHGTINGSVTLDYELKLHGMILGNVVVTSSGVLELHGTVSGDVEVELMGVVNIYGTVNGNVINKGGKTLVSGTINGKLIRQSGIDEVKQNSKISGGYIH
jgi:cytoskeletal protein CcmA (bactofilin family)